MHGLHDRFNHPEKNTKKTIHVLPHTFENIKKSMELGADGFVVKPFSVQKLQEMVEKYRDKLKQAS